MSNSSALTSGIDRSGVTVIGSKSVMPANNTRTGGAFQNTSDTAMSVNMTGADATVTNGLLVPAGAGINITTDENITVYCAVAGKTYVALEY